jgi:hypothetical protein
VVNNGGRLPADLAAVRFACGGTHVARSSGGYGWTVRAVFCNYIPDFLPMAFVKETSQGWQQLSVRTWINAAAVQYRAPDRKRSKTTPLDSRRCDP